MARGLDVEQPKVNDCYPEEFGFRGDLGSKVSSENGNWGTGVGDLQRKEEVKWSWKVGEDRRLPGNIENLFVVCGHEFEVRPLSTVLRFVSSHIFM